MTANDPKRSPVLQGNIIGITRSDGTKFIVINRSRIIEYLGHAAIVLSLVFVAFEIRQSNRIAVGTTSYEIQRNYMTLNELIISSDEMLSKLLVKLQTPDASTELSPEESVKAAALARRFLNMWISIEVAHENGLIPEPIYMSGLEDARNVVRNIPGLTPYFRESFAARPHYTDYQILNPITERRD